MPCRFSGAAFVCFLSFCTYSFTGQAKECPLVQKSDLLQLGNLIFQKNQSVYCKTSLGFPRPHEIASWNTRSSSMYSSRLMSMNTNDRLSDNSFDVSPHKTSTNPSLLFQNLSKLRVHIFDELDMSSVDLGLFTKLSLSLRVLSFHSCKLQGHFPEVVFLLQNMKCLDLSLNLDLYGHLPKSIWSIPLEILDLSSTSFSGGLPVEIGHLKSFQVLWLCKWNSSGLVPASLGHFTQLTRLDLSVNKLKGQIPLTPFSLRSVILFYLSFNNFSGPIPDAFPTMTKLVSLDFSNNRFDASIPMSLLSVPFMIDLDLSNNPLSSHINRVRASSLKGIKLFGNQLEGSIQPSSIELLDLTTLLLSSNRFTGLFDLKMVAQMNKTEPLYLSHNMITLSNVDNDFDHTLPSLSSLRLSGWNLTRFPRFVGMARNLNMLDLPSNQVQGRIPAWMWEVGSESLAYLDLSYNLLTSSEQAPWVNFFLVLHSKMIRGPIPTQLPNSTMFFSISNNEFVQHIPTPICQAENPEILDLSNNHLNSTIPHRLGNFSTIFEVMDMQGNQISGSLPNFTFQESNILRSIHSNRNQEGQLPQLLMNWQRVEVLDLGMSMSKDVFPSQLDTMPNLEVVVLWSNQFQGTINHPGAEFPFPQLRILHISFNKFFGLLTETYFQSTIAVIGLIIEGLLCRRWHHAIERGFEFFTWSFTPTRSTIKGYLRSTKQNPMNRGPFVAFAVVMILIQFFEPAASTLFLKNQCSTLIAICNVDASGPIDVQPNDATSVMEPSGSLIFWAYKNTGDTMCAMENPTVTWVEIDVSSSSYSYKISVENGYNLGIKIMALGSVGCPEAACTAKLQDCPDELKARGPDNVVTACNPPNCSESEELCSLFSSFMGNSQCQKPGSSYEPSNIAASCALSIDLVISFTCG